MLTLIAIFLGLAAAIVVVVLINPSLAEKAGTDAEQEAEHVRSAAEAVYSRITDAAAASAKKVEQDVKDRL